MITVWVNYGLEGWKPNDYESEEEAIQTILRSNFMGIEIRITQDLKLKLEESN